MWGREAGSHCCVRSCWIRVALRLRVDGRPFLPRPRAGAALRASGVVACCTRVRALRCMYAAVSADRRRCLSSFGQESCPRLHDEGFGVPEGNVATWLLAFSLLSNSETRFRVDADSVSVRLRACGPAAVGWPQDQGGSDWHPGYRILPCTRGKRVRYHRPTRSPWSCAASIMWRGLGQGFQTCLSSAESVPMSA